MATSHLPSPQTVPTVDAPLEIIGESSSCCGGTSCGGSANSES
ncbi:hypothetical protein [Microbacterium sp. No. 7]|nr:hypothetical protein [Microbacterium sp. No. 7]